jgi:CubicO group peptidase (beta-lactamase class C family)
MLYACIGSGGRPSADPARLGIGELSQPLEALRLPPAGEWGRSPRYDSLFRAWERRQGFSGVVLLADSSGVAHSGAYGYADRSTRDTLSLSSVFQLASVTKTVTALGVLKLWEEGRLHPDEELWRHLPGFPYPEITIRHLLQHRSGLASYPEVISFAGCGGGLRSSEDVLEGFTRLAPPLRFRPGMEFEYNNANYILLAALIGRAACQPYEQYLASRFFQPLGMEDTYFCDHRERMERPGCTRGYRLEKRRWAEAEGDCMDGIFGDKGLHASAADLYRLAEGLHRGLLLRESTLEAAFSSGLRDLAEPYYGLGWRLRPDLPGVSWHFGWWRGYRSCLFLDRQRRRTVIILSNSDYADLTEQFWEIFFDFSGRYPYK